MVESEEATEAAIADLAQRVGEYVCPLYYLACAGCNEVIEALSDDDAQGLAESAHAQGWRIISGEVYCPTCATKR